MSKPKILYIDNGNNTFPDKDIFLNKLKQLGDFDLIEDGSNMSEDKKADLIRKYDIYITGRSYMAVPEEIADDPGKLKYICGLTGTQRPFITLEHIEAGLLVTNWGDAPADGIAEGAMTLLLAVMKDIRPQIETLNEDGWKLDSDEYVGGTLKYMKLGIYGLGVIGERFVELVEPFKPELYVFDPYVEQLPESCRRVASLEELFSKCQGVVIHAGLSEETKNSVTASLLGLLPDKGIIVNTARGAIIDQEALFAELEKGRLRAGLDVLADGDWLEPGHPAKKWENAIYTTHKVARNNFVNNKDKLERNEEICLNNIERFVNGDELEYVMDKERFLRST
ncbi:MAG: NAD(P)-dependent oxidoreductase [Halanaerobiales bacterium]